MNLLLNQRYADIGVVEIAERFLEGFHPVDVLLHGFTEHRPEQLERVP